jgi:hypothetical protein
MPVCGVCVCEQELDLHALHASPRSCSALLAGLPPLSSTHSHSSSPSPTGARAAGSGRRRVAFRGGGEWVRERESWVGVD